VRHANLAVYGQGLDRQSNVLDRKSCSLLTNNLNMMSSVTVNPQI